MTQLTLAGILLGGAASRTLVAQSAVIALRVVDSASAAPLAQVRVAIAGVSTQGATDAGGRFVYTAPHPGRVVFFLRRLGFVPGTVSVDAVAGDTTRVTFTMTAAVQSLATVTVRDSMETTPPLLSGFERRRANHLGGAFIARE